MKKNLFGMIFRVSGNVSDPLKPLFASYLPCCRPFQHSTLTCADVLWSCDLTLVRARLRSFFCIRCTTWLAAWLAGWRAGRPVRSLAGGLMGCLTNVRSVWSGEILTHTRCETNWGFRMWLWKIHRCEFRCENRPVAHVNFSSLSASNFCSFRS